MKSPHGPVLVDSKVMEAHSREHPKEIFTDEHGRIAWHGQVFNNEKEFFMFMRLVKSPLVQWYLKTTHKMKLFFRGRK